MSNILLVHGSCHGAWCWRDLVPELETLGQNVRAIDLPSHGQDKTPIEQVTLQAYAQAIQAHMTTDTILVGHSMAGYAITAAAELNPTPIQCLVYLCAYVPAKGMSLIDMRKSAPRQPLMHAIQRSEDGLSFSVIPSEAKGVFYQDCTHEQVEYALARLCPQAIAPQDTVIELTRNSLALPRSYILCENDQTIPPEFQKEMTKDWPKEDVFTMATGHSPFFAQPARLAEIIHEIGR